MTVWPNWLQVVLKILKRVRTQLSLLVVMSSLTLLSSIGVIPESSRVTDLLRQALDHPYGLAIIGAISFIENIVAVNVYFPGSITLIAAGAATAGDPYRAVQVFICIVVSAAVMHQINFAIGRLLSGQPVKAGHSGLRDIRDDRPVVGWLLFLATFWHPHLTAVTCVRAGQIGMPYRCFGGMFLAVFLPWELFWGIMIYQVGIFAGSSRNVVPLVYGYIVLWLIWDVVKMAKRPRT